MKATLQIGQGEPAILERPFIEGDLTTSSMSHIEGNQLEKRAERNNFLALSDNKVLPDRGLSDSKVTEWKTYRQSLRDIDFSDPHNITWPTKPTE